MKARGLKLELSDLNDKLGSMVLPQFVLPQFVLLGNPFSLHTKIRQIGEGSFGSVFEAQLSNGLVKAVKIVDAPPHNADFLKALREAEIGIQMKYPHLLSIQEVWYDGNSFFFFMDLVEPLTVSSLTKSAEQKKNLLVLFQQLVSAAEHLYSKGILHRDIKVQNCGIIRDKDGKSRLVLYDFGEACKTSELDQDQECAGTVLHMAPEVMIVFRHGEKSEIWTLISCLIEILLGTPWIYHMIEDAIIRLSASQIQCKIEELTEPPIPEVFKTDKSPAGILLLEILRRGLALNPAERLSFPELQELLQELIALL